MKIPKMKIKIGRRFLEEGMIIPKGYGLSYRIYNYDVVVYHLWPLNIIIGFVRRIYIKIRRYKVKEDLQLKYYMEGYNTARIEDSKIMASTREEIQAYRVANDFLRSEMARLGLTIVERK